MNHFTPFASTFGGVLIGAAAALLLVLDGKVAAVSGIVAGLLRPRTGDTAWQLLFVMGLVAGGALMAALRPESIAATPRGLLTSAVAGVLVGFGSRLGSGCTSGHGICGISRWSMRSIVATATFMLTGAATVFITLHAAGGSR